MIFKKGKVLALRRAAHKDAGPGLWETVSGRVQSGEQPLDAVRREIAEESRLEVELDERPVTVYAARRAGQPMIVILYRAKFLRGRVRRSHEHDAHAWWTPAEFAENSQIKTLAKAVARAVELE